MLRFTVDNFAYFINNIVLYFNALKAASLKEGIYL